jgi:hypothetical protein
VTGSLWPAAASGGRVSPFCPETSGTAPLAQQELIMQALSEAPEEAFAEACGGALREADSCPPGW